MIVDRRSLLKSGAVVSGVLMTAPLPGLGAAAARDSELSIERFVVDSRVPDSIAAARAAAARGIQVSEVDGDLTSLWYDDLNLKWQQRPMTLAGVTGEDALFVLSTLAPQYRMRVVHQQQVGLRNQLPVYQWIIAPA